MSIRKNGMKLLLVLICLCELPVLLMAREEANEAGITDDETPACQRCRLDEPHIYTNLAELEAYTFLNLQLPVLYPADLFDFLAFEMAYKPHPKDRGQAEGRDAFAALGFSG